MSCLEDMFLAPLKGFLPLQAWNRQDVVDLGGKGRGKRQRASWPSPWPRNLGSGFFFFFFPMPSPVLCVNGLDGSLFRGGEDMRARKGGEGATESKERVARTWPGTGPEKTLYSCVAGWRHEKRR